MDARHPQPTSHVALSAAEGPQIHTTYHAQPTATNIKTKVPPSPYGRGAGGEGSPPPEKLDNGGLPFHQSVIRPASQLRNNWKWKEITGKTKTWQP